MMTFGSKRKTWITYYHVTRQSSATYDVLTVSLEGKSSALPLLNALFGLSSLLVQSLSQCPELSRECSTVNGDKFNVTYESMQQYLPQGYSNVSRFVQVLPTFQLVSNPPSKGQPILYINGEKVSHVFQCLNLKGLCHG